MYDKSFNGPLIGKTVGLACSPHKSAKLISGIEALGGRVLPLPVITPEEVADKSAMDDALARLGQYVWVVFTSYYGVLFFLKHMQARGVPASTIKAASICAVGPSTAAALGDFDLKADLIPEEYVAEGILRALARRHGGLEGMAGMRVLLPRAQEARDVLPRELSAAGALVDVVPCYQTVTGGIDDESAARLRSKPPDLLVFTSSSTVKNFVSILGKEDGCRIIREATVAVLGPVTAGTAHAYGKKPEIVPRDNTVASLLESIRAYYQKDP